MTTYTLQQVRDRLFGISDDEIDDLARAFALLSKAAGHPKELVTFRLTPEAALIDITLAREAELRAENERMRTEWNADREHWHAVALSKERRIAELERELAAWKRAVHQECGTTFVIQADGCERTSESRITARVAELLAAPAASQEVTK